MDDELQRRIAASLDLPSDGPADPEVVRALDQHPEAKDFLRGLYTVDHALRRWPAPRRSEAEMDAAAERVLAALAKSPAKVKAKGGVSPETFDATAPTVFLDDESVRSTPMEKELTMSEPQDNDADLAALTALTRTSLGPGALPSTRPMPVGPSITDEVDETSSGIVDIKNLAALSRASVPVPAAAPAAAPEAAKADEKPAAKADAKPVAKADEKPAAAAKASEKKPAAKTDDVMVKKAAAVSPVVAEPPAERKSNSGLYGMLGGIAVTAAAFFVYTQTRSESPTSPAAVEAPSAATAPTTESAPTPTAAPAMGGATPESTAPPQNAPTPEAPVAQAAPTPAPTPEPAAVPPPPAEPAPVAVAAPAVAARDESHAAEAARRARPTTTAAARVAAGPATPTPEPAAPAAPAARPAGAARTPAAAPAQQAAAPAPTAPPPAAAPARPAAPAAAPAAAAPAPRAGGNSVDDLMNRVAPTPAAAAPAAAPTEELPERLTRAQVTPVLSGLNGAVRTCANGQTGTAPVSITISNDGTVSNASVSGQFSGTPVAECIEGVVRRAHFPRFRVASQTLVYPYVILPPRN